MFGKRVQLPADELRSLYVEQGWTTTEIAEHYGVGTSTVRRALEERGVKTRSRGPKGSRELSHLELTESLLRDLYLEQKLSIPQIAEQYGWGRETIRQRMLEYNIPIRSFSEGTLIQHGTWSEYRDFDGDEREKAYLIGFRLGDLNVAYQRDASQVIRISCSSTRMEQIDLIRRLFESYGHINVTHKVRLAVNGMIEHAIICSVNPSFEFLLAYSSRIPQWILDRDEIFLAFFGGFPDAEGSFHLAKYKQSVDKGRFSIKNTDLFLLEQCHAKLTELGIRPTNVSKSYDAGNQTSKRGIFANKALWGFAVENKESVVRLIQLLGPYLRHEKRITDMERVRQNVEWRNSEAFRQEATHKRVDNARRTNEAKKKNQN